MLPSFERVTDKLGWAQVYWTIGKTKDRNAEAQDGPCAGWSHVFVLPGDKRTTIFCPYSFESYQLSNRSSEVRAMRGPREGFRHEWAKEHLPRKWEQLAAFGFQRNYDLAAVVLKELGLEVPRNLPAGDGGEAKERGGKPVESALKKPVKRGSKRGSFLAWFLSDGGGPKSIREAMAEFGITRSNALSYLFMIQKDHGIGYRLVGDAAEVVLPDGCEDPFDGPQAD